MEKAGVLPRVLMITWEYPPRFTGGEGTACRGLVRALIRRGAEVSILLPWASFMKPDEQGELPPLDLPETGYPPEGVYEEPRLPEEIPPLPPGLSFDILHCHDWTTVPAGLELRRRTGKPLVLHIHSLESDRSGGKENPRIAALEAEGCRRADLVIAVSGRTAENLTARYGIPPEKIRVLYNGFELEAPSEPPKNYNPGGKTVLFLGRLAEQKGPDIFLEAARRLAESRNDTVFIVAGAGPLENSLKAYPGLSRAADKIIFTGFVPRGELTALLDSVDLLVAPSLAEPFGIAALEAMSRGVAVVITRTAGLTEITGNLVALGRPDPGDLTALLSRMLDAPEETAALGAAAAGDAEKLGWNIRAEELLGFYREILP